VIAVPSNEFIFDFFYGCAGKMRKLDDHKSSASFSILPQAEDLNICYANFQESLPIGLSDPVGGKTTEELMLDS
jgi:hypothetical protein